MKKKNFGRFTAMGLAALTALPVMSMTASAATSFDYEYKLFSQDLYAESNGNVYYDKDSGVYYPNYAAAKREGATDITAVSKTYKYGITRKYFCTYDGNYYSNENDAAKAAENYGYDNAYFYVSTSGTSSNYVTNSYSIPTFYNNATQRYYTTRAAATAASASGTVSLIYTNTQGIYFNTKVGQYYASYSDAEKASKSSDVITASSSYYYDYYGNDYTYPYYYYDSTYYNNYYYNDPYYYYFYNMTNGTSTSTSSTSTKKTTTVKTTLPAIVGTKTAGWDSIATQIKSNKTGTTNVTLNEATSVDKSVLSALKSANGTLKMTLSNGVSWTIKGSDISTAKSINLNTTLNVKNIPTSLVSKAIKGAKSSAQITIGDNASLGLSADVTVKFSAKRAGYSAKVYRYNTAKGGLELVDTCKINSTGNATFTVDKGGEYLIVIG